MNFAVAIKLTSFRPRVFPDNDLSFIKQQRRVNNRSQFIHAPSSMRRICSRPKLNARRNEGTKRKGSKKRTKTRVRETISKEFVAFAKNAEDLRIASFCPFRLATLSLSLSGGGGQLFYWLRVAAHALGTTVSVNRANPPSFPLVLATSPSRRPRCRNRSDELSPWLTSVRARFIFFLVRRRHLFRRMS